MHVITLLAALLTAFLDREDVTLIVPGAAAPAAIVSASPNGLCVWQVPAAAVGPRGGQLVGCYAWERVGAAAEAAWARRIDVRAP